MPKPNLVIVVGAGASIACGIPGTEALTDTAIDSLRKHAESVASLGGGKKEDAHLGSEAVDKLIKALKGEYVGGLNFEVLLHALRWLADYIAAREGHIGFGRGMTPIGYPHASTFLTTPVDVLEFFKNGTLTQAGFAMIKGLHTRLASAMSSPEGDVAGATAARVATNGFFKKLSESFRLIVIDLNYDALVDDAPVAWSDGFTEASEYGYEIFDPKRFWDAARSDSSLLLHIHGSIRFGYQHYEDKLLLSSAWEPVKYKDGGEASKTLRWRGSRKTIIGGEERGIFVLLSALEKASNLTYNVRPYGHYFTAAIDGLLNSTRVLVLGYGGHDMHLNAWIEESAEIQGSDRRAVIVSPNFNDWNNSPRRGEWAAAYAVQGPTHSGKDSIAVIGKGKSKTVETETLKVFDATIPEAYQRLDEIIEFLSWSAH